MADLEELSRDRVARRGCNSSSIFVSSVHEESCRLSCHQLVDHALHSRKRCIGWRH